jgi:hypothetical protein
VHSAVCLRDADGRVYDTAMSEQSRTDAQEPGEVVVRIVWSRRSPEARLRAAEADFDDWQEAAEQHGFGMIAGDEFWLGGRTVQPHEFDELLSAFDGLAAVLASPALQSFAAGLHAIVEELRGQRHDPDAHLRITFERRVSNS